MNHFYPRIDFHSKPNHAKAVAKNEAERTETQMEYAKRIKSCALVSRYSNPLSRCDTALQRITAGLQQREKLMQILRARVRRFGDLHVHKQTVYIHLDARKISPAHIYT